ncbi:dihydropseudooxynicotine hydrolase [Ophiostoma piceae UAMH 11346]|uniref:Dihydropseudooxynicotine hydrolase n=1 Tax=Ophiostoma piceae (strain UAMH 11346) TaxID=1262450 RepID=S3BSI1_OPHP1|nr:dihydropseudooxynicotine hydrolase [Ophiostoma piceae UAMH 11346]
MFSKLISATLAGFLVSSVHAAPAAHSSATTNTTLSAMLPLSSDTSFSYEILRDLGLARYFGADVGEVLQAAGNVTAADMEGFSDTFANLANHVYSQAQAINSSEFPVSARDFYFRAATYFRSADFYLHGNASDARIMAYFANQTDAFDKAISLLDIPGQRINLKAADGSFTIPCIYYQASGANATHPKPTVILGNGYDGAQEEMLHVSGFAALERGYNVLTYEGPGQPSVRRYQNLGFITEWEKVVTPIVDFLVSGARPEVDAARLGLFGYSMGGFLAVRAAAFEHRLAAVWAVDGLFDVFEPYYNAFKTTPLGTLWNYGEQTGNYTAFDNEMDAYLFDSGLADTETIWGIVQGIWSFNVQTPSEFLRKAKPMTLQNISHQVTTPVWIGAPSEDIFFPGQPQKVRDSLNPGLATFHELGAADGAQNHCHVGAMSLVNELIFDWFAGVIQ